MTEELRQRFGQMPDSVLRDQYANHREEYTDEALAIIKNILSSRGIDISDILPDNNAPQRMKYKPEDFTALEHGFSQIDILLAQLILRDNNIPFYVEIPAAQSTILPIDNEILKHYVIHVLRDKAEQARIIIDEHFSGHDGKYNRKQAQGRDRLRSFSFTETPFGELEIAENVAVEFSAGEKQQIVSYIGRALAEADEIEKKLERGIFYYDNMESLRDHLENAGGQLTRADLLTILEVLQIFCDDEGFPHNLEQVAEAILNFLEPAE
jgi:hypothetical protein